MDKNNLTEKEKYVSVYSGELGEYYKANDSRGQMDGAYGRACWGEGALPFLKAWNAQSVLDVGCGFGVFCQYASQFIPVVYGADIASVATGNTVKNPRITFIDAEAKSIPLPDGAVEYVCSFDCLEHCPESEIDIILDEFNRIATKGFILSIAETEDVLNGVPLHLTIKPIAWWVAKAQRLGSVTLDGEVPLTKMPYILVRKA